MARRIGLVLALLLGFGAARGHAGMAAKAGVSRALLGDWERVAAALGGDEGEGRTDRYFRAAAQLQLGHRQAALAALRQLSDTPGAFAGPALELAVASLFADARYGEIVQWAEASAAERFRDVDALHYRVGQSHLLLGQFDAAERRLGAVAEGPYLPYALHSRSLVELRGGRYGPAVERLGAAVVAAESQLEGEVATALADRLRVARGQAIYQVATSATRLAETEQRGLAELALQQFQRVPRSSPFFAPALRGVGWCALELGQSSEALAAFDAASGMDPAGAAEDAWAQGRVYERLGYYEEASRMYRAAQDAALARAAQLSAETGPGWDEAAGSAPIPGVHRWRQRAERAQKVAGRAARLAPVLALAGQGLEARRLRLRRIGEQVDRYRQRAQELTAELYYLGEHLWEYLDRIPAVALFPKPARGRIGSVSARQRRLDLDIQRVEQVFAAVATSRLWSQAPPPQQQRAEVLWQRLQRAKKSLGSVQLRFLLTLKDRVSAHEARLAQEIRRLTAAVAALEAPLQETERQLAAADARTVAWAERVAAAAGRATGVEAPLTQLAAEAEAQVVAVQRQAGHERAAALRLQADAFALDEVQALHLLEERVRRKPEAGP